MKIYLFIFLLMISCNKHEAVKNVPVNLEVQILEDDFFPEYYSKDTLSLDVIIDDCGEWGGPEDRYRIYIDSLRQYVLSFERNGFICDNSTGIHQRTDSLEIHKIFLLNDAGKKVVSDFLVDLMKAKVHEKLESDAASGYKLFNNDSTLFIYVGSTDNRIEEDYYKFKKNLGLPVNRRKEEDKPEIINN